MSFTKADWSVGQAVVVSRPGRQGTETFDGTVTAVGRAWVTVKTQEWSRTRFDFSGRDESNTGWRSTLWPNRAAFELHQSRRALWLRLSRLVQGTSEPPQHLDLAQVQALLDVLEPRS